jgi:hypothetical protein
MRRPLFFSTSFIPSDLSQAKEGATTHSSLVPITPAVTDEQKLLLPKLQKKIQLDIIHHGFETHNQTILAAGASKKTEKVVRY